MKRKIALFALAVFIAAAPRDAGARGGRRQSAIWRNTRGTVSKAGNYCRNCGNKMKNQVKELYFRHNRFWKNCAKTMGICPRKK